MEVDRTTIPGRGVVHHVQARSGARLAVLAEIDGRKHLLVYDTADEPSIDVVLDPDEADEFAQLLHSTSITDRVARLEQLLSQLPRGQARIP